MKGKKSSKGKRVLLDEQQKTIEKIGARIKEFRLKRGYQSYEKFAFEHDIDRAQYGRMERGSNLQISTLLKVLAVLEVTLEEFFEGFD